jgi:pimeloyl-ACP methyl ester carboxylesterase
VEQALIEASGDRTRHGTFIQSGDVRLRVHAVGAGPVIVFLHGWALDLDMWQPQFADLARDHRVVAFDRRGFGMSSGVPDLVREVDDLRDIARTLGIQRMTLVGMSQAARVALQFAQSFPGYLASLILDGPPSMAVAVMEDVPMTHYRELVASEGLDAFRAQWQQHPLMRLHDSSRQPLLRRIVARYPGRDLKGTGDSAGPATDVAAIATRALVINGELDSPARLIAGDDLARRLPDATHVTVVGTGHLPNLDNPERYNALVRAFVRGNA